MLVVGACDLQVDRGSERIVRTTDQHGVREVGDTFDEGNQKCISTSWKHQRQRHRGKYLPTGSTHVARSFLKRRIDVAQKTSKHHVAHGEEGKYLYQCNTPEAVDIVVINPQQIAGNNARLTKEHDDRKRQHKRRRHNRKNRNHLEESTHEATIKFDIHLNIGKQKADQRSHNTYEKANVKRVKDSRLKSGHRQDARENIECRTVFAYNTIHHKDGKWIENKEYQASD